MSETPYLIRVFRLSSPEPLDLLGFENFFGSKPLILLGLKNFLKKFKKSVDKENPFCYSKIAEGHKGKPQEP